VSCSRRSIRAENGRFLRPLPENRIVAKRLVEHLERAGFLVMKSRRSAARRSRWV
jgi:hypothetical protein